MNGNVFPGTGGPSTTPPVHCRQRFYFYCGSPGLHGPRLSINGTDLLDVLYLPVQLNQNVDVTIALQRVVENGSSDYTSRVITVPALGGA